MKMFKTGFLGLAVLMSLNIPAAEAVVEYTLTITNGSSMPLSPAAVYVKNGQMGLSEVGQKPGSGFIKLCQGGDAQSRVAELKKNTSLSFLTATQEMIFPGESKRISVKIKTPEKQSLHFETMYGKTKDACGVISVNSHDLQYLRSNRYLELTGKDQAVSTGAFLSPRLPQEGNACADATDAIACLRELALANPSVHYIHFFRPYFPSVVNFLEDKFGADDVDTLIFPASGAIYFSLSLKH